MSDRAELYRDAAGEFRWRRTAANNEEVAASSESYEHAQDARENYWRVNGPEAPDLQEES